jgi:hypothetical protein
MLGSFLQGMNHKQSFPKRIATGTFWTHKFLEHQKYVKWLRNEGGQCGQLEGTTSVCLKDPDIIKTRDYTLKWYLSKTTNCYFIENIQSLCPQLDLSIQKGTKVHESVAGDCILLKK